MLVVPEVRRSELNAIRQFLFSFRDEEHAARLAGAMQSQTAPLRVRVHRARKDHRLRVEA